MTTKTAILQAIRGKCLDCSGGRRADIRMCTLTGCSLWPYRMGADPEPGLVRGCAKRSLATASFENEEVGGCDGTTAIRGRSERLLARSRSAAGEAS